MTNIVVLDLPIDPKREVLVSFLLGRQEISGSSRKESDFSKTPQSVRDEPDFGTCEAELTLVTIALCCL